MHLPSTATITRIIRRGAANALLLGAVVMAAVMLLPAIFGLQRYVITGGSMEGSISRGSIVFDEPVPVEELEVGDVITYVPPAGENGGGFVTHRIVSITERDGESALRTKGDANEYVDPWTFSLPESTQARVEMSIPLLGYPIAALGIREVRMALIGLPALLIALGTGAHLWRESGRDRTPEPAAESGVA